MPTRASSRSTRHRRPSLAGASASENAAAATSRLLCTVKKLNMRTNRAGTGTVPVRTFSTDWMISAITTRSPVAPFHILLAGMLPARRTVTTAATARLSQAAGRRLPRAESAALKETAGPRAAEELAVAYQDVAPLQHDLGHAADGTALVAAVVDAHVVRRRGQRPARRGVEDDDVGVRAGRQRSLARVQPEHPGRGRGDQLDEPHRGDMAGRHAAVPQQRVAVFHAGQPVGDRREVIRAEGFLFLVVERAVVRRDHRSEERR